MIEAKAFAYETRDQWEKYFRLLFACNEFRDFANGLKSTGTKLALSVRNFKICGAFYYALFKSLNELFDLCGHGVERSCQCADFILGHDGGGHFQIAGCDLGCGISNGEDGLRDLAGDQVGAESQDDGGDESYNRYGDAELSCRFESLLLIYFSQNGHVPVLQASVNANNRSATIVGISSSSICAL